MPGMMETILNLGLNDRTVLALSERSRNRRFAFDSYRRFLCAYGSVVLGLPRDSLEAYLDQAKKRLARAQDTAVPADVLEEICGHLQRYIREAAARPVPRDPEEQPSGPSTPTCPRRRAGTGSP